MSTMTNEAGETIYPWKSMWGIVTDDDVSVGDHVQVANQKGEIATVVIEAIQFVDGSRGTFAKCLVREVK